MTGPARCRPARRRPLIAAARVLLRSQGVLTSDAEGSRRRKWSISVAVPVCMSRAVDWLRCAQGWTHGWSKSCTDEVATAALRAEGRGCIVGRRAHSHPPAGPGVARSEPLERSARESRSAENRSSFGSFAGQLAACTTSGPGFILKQEALGLAVMTELPLVVVDIQRAGPSTGMPTRTQQSDILSTAYASHGDTKQVLLFPSTPRECFDFGAQSFDLAERLQTPIILMTDLDLGMNDNMSEPLEWEDGREYDRGKIMTAEELEAGADFGRYTDVDGDAICYRTYPGTHPNRGAFFTRGTSRDEKAVYTEKGEEYEENMLRLMRKWDTIKEYVPGPQTVPASQKTDTAVLYYGTSEESSREALDYLAADGVHMDAMRVRAFPFNDEVKQFIEDHEQVFVIEQNRDAQLRTLLMAELEFGPDKLKSVLCFDGTPISARNIRKQIMQHLDGGVIEPLHRTKVASSAGE